MAGGDVGDVSAVGETAVSSVVAVDAAGTAVSVGSGAAVSVGETAVSTASGSSVTVGAAVAVAGSGASVTVAGIGVSVGLGSDVSVAAAAIGTAVFILLFGGGLEEFGWRGYALDRLQTGQNAIAASLVLGFFWGLWHLPLFFIDTSVQAQAAIPIWEFVLQQMLLAIFYTWLYNNTRGTLLVAILFHTIGNTSAALLPPYFGTEIGRCVNFILLAITALLVAITWGWRTLNRGQTVPQPSLHHPSA